jgi:deoxyribonuclease-4
MNIGAHVSIAGGLCKALERARDLGCDCAQVFIRNPRIWSDKRISQREADAFKLLRRQLRISPLVVHLSYLPNLGAPDREDWIKGVTHFLEEYEDAAKIGAELFVLHPGSAKRDRRRNAIPRVAEALREAVKKIKSGPVLLLENMPGAGRQLGSTPEELGEIAALVKAPKRLGVCFDTAHAYAAGINLTHAEGMESMRKRYRLAFGYDPVRLLHVNDINASCGSGRDLHAHLGRGRIGEEGFRHVFRAAEANSLPVILETPIDDDGDQATDLAFARALA